MFVMLYLLTLALRNKVPATGDFLHKKIKGSVETGPWSCLVLKVLMNTSGEPGSEA